MGNPVYCNIAKLYFFSLVLNYQKEYLSGKDPLFASKGTEEGFQKREGGGNLYFVELS